MSGVHIHSGNVGRIAERIVSNELESRGYRVSDLNKEGTSANADLLAVRDGKSWQIQVKGSTHDRGCWFNYGHCNKENIDKGAPMYNRSDSFYRAQIVALVCVESASLYTCVLLPVTKAEELARLNIEREYKPLNKDGTKKKPGPVWSSLKDIPLRLTNEVRKQSMSQEQDVLQAYRDKWDIDDSTILPVNT
jgi:hypothetical protein